MFLKATGSEGRVWTHSNITDPTVVISRLPSLAIFSSERCIPSATNSTWNHQKHRALWEKLQVMKCSRQPFLTQHLLLFSTLESRHSHGSNSAWSSSSSYLSQAPDEVVRPCRGAGQFELMWAAYVDFTGSQHWEGARCHPPFRVFPVDRHCDLC